jgi:hypothetical protein
LIEEVGKRKKKFPPWIVQKWKTSYRELHNSLAMSVIDMEVNSLKTECGNSIHLLKKFKILQDVRWVSPKSDNACDKCVEQFRWSSTINSRARLKVCERCGTLRKKPLTRRNEGSYTTSQEFFLLCTSPVLLLSKIIAF